MAVCWRYELGDAAMRLSSPVKDSKNFAGRIGRRSKPTLVKVKPAAGASQ